MFRTKKQDGLSVEGIFSLDFPSDTTLNKAENIFKCKWHFFSFFRTNKQEHLPLASIAQLYLACELTKMKSILT